MPASSSDQILSLPSAAKHGQSCHHSGQLSSKLGCAWRRIPRHSERTYHQPTPHPRGTDGKQARALPARFRGAQSQPCTVTARGCIAPQLSSIPSSRNTPKIPPRYGGPYLCNTSIKEISSTSPPALQGDAASCPRTRLMLCSTWVTPTQPELGGAGVRGDTLGQPNRAAPVTVIQPTAQKTHRESRSGFNLRSPALGFTEGTVRPCCAREVHFRSFPPALTQGRCPPARSPPAPAAPPRSSGRAGHTDPQPQRGRGRPASAPPAPAAGARMQLFGTPHTHRGRVFRGNAGSTHLPPEGPILGGSRKG